jgi:hypothetical protein
MYTSDKRILRLIELLIFQKQISFIKDFCMEIDMQDQTITKIKKGTSHFTVQQIETMCKKYKVNANWIFGIDSKVFNTPKSIEIKEV